MYQTFRFQRVVLLGAAIGTAGLVFAAPQCCARALQQGLALCGGPLLVSLFPFLIVSTLLMRCGAGQVLGFVFRPVARLIGVRSPAAGGVLLIGFLGGFAPAAAAVAEAVRSRELTPQEASALLPACICSGPSFVILTAGEQLLGSRVLGIRLFAAQVLAGYLTAALLNRLHPAPAAPVRSAQSTQTAPPRLDEVIAQAAVQYLKLCGFVLYFRMLAAGCGQFLPAAWAPFPAMLLEVCSGCDYAARTRPVGQQSVLRRPQRTGGVGAAAGAHPLPRRSVLPSAAGRSAAAPAAVAGIVLPDMAGTGRGDLWQPVRTGHPHAAGAAGLCAAGLCRVLHGSL